MEVNFKSHKDEVLRELEKKVNLACKLVGEAAEGFAKDNCPVDTGRLRNSITYATPEYNGKGTYSDNEGNTFNDASAKGKPEKGEVYIGTNVEYAFAVELMEYSKTGKEIHHKSGRAHFLRDAATQHGDKYKEITKLTLEE